MAAEQNVEGYIRLPATFLRPPEARFFLLRVRGDSMNRAEVNGDRIENGDLVLVRQQTTGEPGQIVVAMIDGEATIKELHRAPGYFVLKPRSTNPRNQPIVVGPELQVQGVVQRVLKNGAEMLLELEE